MHLARRANQILNLNLQMFPWIHGPRSRSTLSARNRGGREERQQDHRPLWLSRTPIRATVLEAVIHLKFTRIPQVMMTVGPLTSTLTWSGWRRG